MIYGIVGGGVIALPLLFIVLSPFANALVLNSLYYRPHNNFIIVHFKNSPGGEQHLCLV